MKGFFRLFIGMFLIFILTGCIGEDYDVGVPTAHLYSEDLATSVQLAEGNVSWSSSSGDVDQKIDDIQEFGLSQEKMKVTANEKVSLDFQENARNGGDIWTDPKITVALLKDEQRIELELHENREFQIPNKKGWYVLEVVFTSSRGTAQYVGNILIQ
ncbi:hypothetical protein QUF81_25160 [Peribacillus simplex]|uniref:hypothetical protein n=1 Tax=Peribacillus simplex TaxID=1478 RepID=UPI000777CC01|nr:hypothetical protein [Peribacillus simplex]AMM93053.1 hypothetical protein UP17_11455 [Peribacillus simplex]MDM5296375.1 hypothetical protein [Peribacillus simplex]